MVPQVLEVLVPTISGFTTGREAKLEAGKSEAPVTVGWWLGLGRWQIFGF